MNRRLYEGLMIVETPIYRVFLIYDFHQKTLTEPYCLISLIALIFPILLISPNSPGVHTENLDDPKLAYPHQPVLSLVNIAAE
jgi:hypothetical protein